MRISIPGCLTALSLLTLGTFPPPARAADAPVVSPEAQAKIDAAAITQATYEAEAKKQEAIKAQIDNAKETAGAFPSAGQPGSSTGPKTTLNNNGLDHAALFALQKNLVETGRQIGTWARTRVKDQTLIVVNDAGLAALTQVGRDTQYTLNLLLQTMRSEVDTLRLVEQATKDQPEKKEEKKEKPAPAAAPGGQAPVPAPTPENANVDLELAPPPNPLAAVAAVGAVVTIAEDIASSLRANYTISAITAPTDVGAVFAGITEKACGGTGKCFLAQYTAMPLSMPLNGCLQELSSQQVTLAREIGLAQGVVAQHPLDKFPYTQALTDEIAAATAVAKSYTTAVTALTAPATGGGPSTMATASNALALLFSAAGQKDLKCDSITGLADAKVHLLVVHPNEMGGSVMLEDETFWHNPRASRQGTSVISAFLVDELGSTYASATVNAEHTSFIDLPWAKDTGGKNTVSADGGLTVGETAAGYKTSTAAAP